ncbi:MAG TPA: hypothetical protein VFV57_06060 [Limnobacter sp.]|nr:hypothetical protein [Limnobacter sp.]
MNQAEQMRDKAAFLESRRQEALGTTNSWFYAGVKAAEDWQALASECQTQPSGQFVPVDEYKGLPLSEFGIGGHVANAQPAEPVAFGSFNESSFANLWLRYCEKKMECDDLKLRIAELEFHSAEPMATDTTTMAGSNLADDYRTIAKWLNEEIDTPIDRQALARVLAAKQPAKLVRLTEMELWRNDELMALNAEFGLLFPDVQRFANAIMDAMDRINGGAN